MLKRVGKIIAIILVNIIVVAALLEVALRVAMPVLPDALAISARWVTSGQPFAEEWSPGWQQSREHHYALKPGLENQLQYGSPRVQFSISTIELWEGGGIGFRTDPVDFRVDAVVVGDSFGFCYVERADCWVDRLAAQTNLGTVNLSQPVTGSMSHMRILRDFGSAYEPPLVIWQFFGNDFNDDYQLAVFRDEIDEIPYDVEQQQMHPLRQWFRENSVLYAVTVTATTGYFPGLAETEAIFSKPYTATYGDNDEHTLIYGSLYEQIALDMSREQNQIGYAYSREAFTQAQTIVSGWDGDLVVVLIPTREEVYRHITNDALSEETLAALGSARDAMQALCNELSNPCYDAYDVLQERALQGEALYHVDDMHLNPHGNAVLAEALRVWLNENGLNPLIGADS